MFQLHAIIKNNMAGTRSCEAIAKQASLTLGTSNEGYETWNTILSVLRCVYNIKCGGKFLSPVGSTISVTVGASVMNVQHRWLIQWS